MSLFVTQQSLAQGAAENASKPLGKNILSFCLYMQSLIIM